MATVACYYSIEFKLRSDLELKSGGCAYLSKSRHDMRTWLITGGAGFIGSNFVLSTCVNNFARVINLDKLTYAGHLENLKSLEGNRDHIFVKGDIGDSDLVHQLLREYRPTAIINFAAESHVDRSILGPQAFIETNVVGTHALLANVLQYWKSPGTRSSTDFRFLHISTDEVYGSLETDTPAFTEEHPYRPNSPYAASKAASDHLVRAYYHTYGLPTLTTNCSNNYGPYQHPEKLIPLIIQNARAGEPLPIYGDGRQIRDWLYVEDHCAALRTVLERGHPGETYNIGGNCERTNLDVVQTLCRILDDMFTENAPHERLIMHVTDRPGHDRRYAVNSGKIQRELSWRPQIGLEQGLTRTVHWYIDHTDWIRSVSSTQHEQWLKDNYQSRG